MSASTKEGVKKRAWGCVEEGKCDEIICLNGRCLVGESLLILRCCLTRNNRGACQRSSKSHQKYDVGSELHGEHNLGA